MPPMPPRRDLPLYYYCCWTNIAIVPTTPPTPPTPTTPPTPRYPCYRVQAYYELLNPHTQNKNIVRSRMHVHITLSLPTRVHDHRTPPTLRTLNLTFSNSCFSTHGHLGSPARQRCVFPWCCWPIINGFRALFSSWSSPIAGSWVLILPHASGRSEWY